MLHVIFFLPTTRLFKPSSQNLLAEKCRMSTRILKHEFSRRPSYFVSHTNPKISIYLVQASLPVKISIGVHTPQFRDEGKRTLVGRDLRFAGPPKAFTMHLGRTRFSHSQNLCPSTYSPLHGLTIQLPFGCLQKDLLTVHTAHQHYRPAICLW
jgi:hypothetical protein